MSNDSAISDGSAQPSNTAEIAEMVVVLFSFSILELSYDCCIHSFIGSSLKGMKWKIKMR